VGQKNMKPEKALLHGTQCRFIRHQACFIRQSRAS